MINLNADNFHEVAFKFRKFNLVCGLNGVGKTEIVNGVLENAVTDRGSRCVTISNGGSPFLMYREKMFNFASGRLQERANRRETIDHLINLISHEDVRILWVTQDQDDNVGLEWPEVYKSGGIRRWPKGFFDQFEMDYRRIMGG